MTSILRLAPRPPARSVERGSAVRARALLLLATAALALATAGCGKIGCFQWTEAEGACPAQDEALAYFGGGQCGSAIESVDSEGEFDGQYCCYDITKSGDDYYYDCAIE
jgi:hypothetical protein